MRKIFLLSLSILTVNGETFYKAAESCVFEPLKVVSPSSSKLQCAIRCEQSECKAFQFDKNRYRCTLYQFDNICQSNTKCDNVPIMINDRYNEKFHSDLNSPGFQILNNIKYENIGYTRTFVIEIIDKKQSRPLLKDPNGDVIMAFGMYGKRKLVILPPGNITPNINNLLSFLTNNMCTNMDKCLMQDTYFKERDGTDNLVFMINRNMEFNFEEFKENLLRNQWHFVIVDSSNDINISKNIQDLLKIFGMCCSDKHADYSGRMEQVNVCQNITIYNHVKCKQFR